MNMCILIYAQRVGGSTDRKLSNYRLRVIKRSCTTYRQGFSSVIQLSLLELVEFLHSPRLQQCIIIIILLIYELGIIYKGITVCGV
jgi:hypothetical protein